MWSCDRKCCRLDIEKCIFSVKKNTILLSSGITETCSREIFVDMDYLLDISSMSVLISTKVGTWSLILVHLASRWS